MQVLQRFRNVAIGLGFTVLRYQLSKGLRVFGKIRSIWVIAVRHLSCVGFGKFPELSCSLVLRVDSGVIFKSFLTEIFRTLYR